MNKKLLSILTIASLLFTTTSIKAQEAFDKGKIVVTAGYGIPNLSSLGARVLYNDDDYGTGFAASSTGPILLKAEYGIIKRWALVPLLVIRDITPLGIFKMETFIILIQAIHQLHIKKHLSNQIFQ